MCASNTDEEVWWGIVIGNILKDAYKHILLEK